ncbi:MAG: hypothetical protein EPN37_16615 [Chitinophagaceae bacterium]|nr:MAG: hypothetical protein EPN37_16615 [Chitinophagaceae bacterium]
MIRHQRWFNWHETNNEQMVYYVEYKNTCLCVASGQRVVWSHHLNNTQAKQSTFGNIFHD